MILRCAHRTREGSLGYHQHQRESAAARPLTIAAVAIKRQEGFRRAVIPNRAACTATRERGRHKGNPPFNVGSEGEPLRMTAGLLHPIKAPSVGKLPNFSL